MADEKEGCVTPSVGPILEETAGEPEQAMPNKEVHMVRARVGKEAPDFALSAFHEGKFKNIQLSDYKGKWIVICFYPGDFTFV